MIYMIINKINYQVTAHMEMNERDVPENLHMLFPFFNPNESKDMSIVYAEWTLNEFHKYRENIGGHFNISEDGKLVEKTLTEKAQLGSVSFDTDLLAKSEEIEKIEGKTQAIRVVKLGLKLKLCNGVAACDKAFELINQEIAQRIIEAGYDANKELKLTKGLMEWVQAGQPSEVEGKNPQEQYQKMQDYISEIKSDYTDLRAELKDLVTTIKQVTI